MSTTVKRVLWLLLAVAAVAAIVWALERHEAAERATAGRNGSLVFVDKNLPPEANETLALIAAGGPFPYHRDGSTYLNWERRLPEHPGGYYHEYTVDTPGAADRGGRRIVTGGNPPEVYYYSEDHYRTFRRLEVTDARR
jgi:guanyl-specific ribonuclease Sa